MPRYRSPEGKVIRTDERWDETREGVDINREKMISKGWTPVVKFYTPDASKSVLVNQTSENIDKMTKKGWKLDVQKEAEERALQGAEGSGLKQGTITQAEVAAIARLNNVSFESLDPLVEFIGLQPEYREPNVVRTAAGFLGSGLGGNIPQFIYRELQTPEQQKAFSMLQEIADARKSGVMRYGAEMLTGFGIGGTMAAAMGKQFGSKAALATAAASGSVYGAAASEEGEEWKGAAFGAGAGLALGSIGALFNRKVKPEEVEKVLAETKRAAGKDLDRLIAEAKAKDAPLLNLREELVTGPATPEKLEALGQQIVEKRFKEKSVAKVIEDGPLTKDTIRELGSIDIDYQTMKLARELGYQGRVVKYKKLSEDRGKFSREVSRAQNFIARFKNKVGAEEEIKNAFTRITDRNIVKKAMLSQFKNDKQERFVGLRQFFEAPVDGKYVARGIDRRLGTNMERVILDMDSATNQLSFILAQANTELKKITNAAKAAKLDTSDFRKYIEDDKVFSKLNPEQQKVVRSASEFFEKHRKDVEEGLGFKIPKRDNYFPHRTPSMLETIQRIKGRAAAIKESTGIDLMAKRGAGNEAFKDLKEEEWTKILETDPDLIKALELLNRTKITKPETFMKNFFMAITPGAGKAPMQATEASAAFLREDKIPSFLLSNDLVNGGMGWVQETYRHVLIKDSLAELQRIRDIASVAKDVRATSYLNGLLDDMTGLRVGTLASETTKAKLAFRIKMDDIASESKSRLVRSTARVFRDAPEAFSTMLATAYPNFLGLSPRAIMMNLSQIPTMTIPELGDKLGGRYGLVALGQIAKTYAKGEEIIIKNPYVAQILKKNVGDKVRTRSIGLVLANEGQIAKQFTQELADALRNDMKLSLPVEAYKTVANRYGNFAMGVFSYTETINRYLVTKMGRGLAQDLAKGDADVVQWLRRTPVSNQRRMLQLVEAGDVESLTKEVQDYLLSKTILNYTRQSMSNFGRFMGPMFSMFTKWPSTVYGETIEQYATKGFTKGSVELAKRYMAPLAILAAIDYGVLEEDGEVEDPVLRALFGKRGVTGWAPVTSLEAIAGGEFLKSPASDVIGQVGKLAFDPANEKQWLKAMNELSMTFIPGMSLLRVMNQEAPLLAGEKDTKSFRPSDVLGDE